MTRIMAEVRERWARQHSKCPLIGTVALAGAPDRALFAGWGGSAVQPSEARQRGRAPSPTQPHRDRHNDGLAVAVISAMIAVFDVELRIVKVVQTIRDSSAVIKAAGILGI